MTGENVTQTAGAIEKYGVGTVAIAIVFITFVVMIGILAKLVYDNNTNHRKEMVPVLKALTDSLNALTETQLAFKDLLIDRLGGITSQGVSTHALLETHVRDTARLETTISTIHPSIVKMEERTKACLERRKDML